MCKIGVNIPEDATRPVCAYAHVFLKRPGCARIGVCALIRMNTVNCNWWLCLFHVPHKGHGHIERSGLA